jgi:hypothetical protein
LSNAVASVQGAVTSHCTPACWAGGCENCDQDSCYGTCIWDSGMVTSGCRKQCMLQAEPQCSNCKVKEECNPYQCLWDNAHCYAL